MLTLNRYYSKCKEWTLADPSALNVCLYNQHELPALATDYIMKDAPLAFTDAFKLGFCYVDQRNFSWLNYFQ